MQTPLSQKAIRKLSISLVLILAVSLVPILPAEAPEYKSYKGYCWGETSYTWISRVSTSPIAVGDDVGTWFTLPWAFTYFGESKTRVHIRSNGYLLFDPTPVPTGPDDYENSPDKLKTRWKIAPFWDDLRTDRAGGIVTTPGVYVDSYSDKVVITWEATHYLSTAYSIKLQAVLYRWTSNIQISLNDATSLANFTPTMGVSKGDKAGFYHITGDMTRIATSKTWLFRYDVGCFMWERPGTVGHWPWQYVRRGACLMIPGGWADYEDYGECGCGPTVSRNYAPDYWYPYWGSNYLLSDIRWDVNQYSSAQSITGYSYAYVSEFRIATAYGDFNYFYSTLPNAQFYIGEAETWGGQTTKAGEIYTQTPEQIVAGKYYYADAYFKMTSGVPKDSTAYEYEMKIDDWPYYLLHPGGYPLDWWKVYWAPIYTIERPLDSPVPFDWLSVTEFPGGAIVVEDTSDNIILIRTMSGIESKESLKMYINSRIDALTQIITKSETAEYISVTITFARPLQPASYVAFSQLHGLTPSYYRFASEHGSGIAMVREPSEPFRWDVARDLWEGRRDKMLGVTAVSGLMKVQSIEALMSDPRVLLIDPKEDLIVRNYIDFYSGYGDKIVVQYPDDIWVEYKLYD